MGILLHFSMGGVFQLLGGGGGASFLSGGWGAPGLSIDFDGG